MKGRFDMQKKAVVIRMVGDADMGGEMAKVVMQPLQAEELARVKAELDQLRAERSAELEQVKAEVERLRGEEAENGVRKVRDAEYFKRRIRRARRKYKVKQPNRVAERLLIAYALAALTVQQGFRRLAAWNRA